MATQEVKATANLKNEDGSAKESVEVSINFDFGTNLKDAVKSFGEDVVFGLFKQQAIINLQSRMRAIACSEKGPKGVTEGLKDWKPGVVTRQKKSDAEKLAEFFKGKSPEEIQKMLAAAQTQEKAA